MLIIVCRLRVRSWRDSDSTLTNNYIVYNLNSKVDFLSVDRVQLNSQLFAAVSSRI